MADYEKLRQRNLEENKKKIEELKLGYLSCSFHESAVKPSPVGSIPPLSSHFSPLRYSQYRDFWYSEKWLLVGFFLILGLFLQTKQVKRKLDQKQREIVVLRRSGRVANRPGVNYKEEPQYFIVERSEIRRKSFKRKLDDRVYASDEAREYATDKAWKLMDDLGSKYPSFVKPMTQSHVTGGFWLGLPRSFCTKHLPKKDTAITLVDEDGDKCNTNYLAQKNGLSAGWRGFSIDHNLVDGDALVFQLVTPTTFKVYIVRASEYDDNA